MGGGEQPEAAEPGQRIRREHQNKAERQHQFGHGDRQEGDETRGDPQSAAGAGLDRIGQRQADQDVQHAGGGDDLEAGGEGAVKAGITSDLDKPARGETGGQ